MERLLYLIPRPENYTKSLIKTVGWVDETSGYIPHDLQFATMKVGLHLHCKLFVLHTIILHIACRKIYQNKVISKHCCHPSILCRRWTSYLGTSVWSSTTRSTIPRHRWAQRRPINGWTWTVLHIRFPLLWMTMPIHLSNPASCLQNTLSIKQLHWHKKWSNYSFPGFISEYL